MALLLGSQGIVSYFNWFPNINSNLNSLHLFPNLWTNLKIRGRVLGNTEILWRVRFSRKTRKIKQV